MLGRVPDLDFLGQSACLFWRECGVKRILVLDYGKKLTEDTGNEVRKNPDDIAAYLGTHA